MTITVYGIKSCSTMKKTFTLLDELFVDYQFHDYKKQTIDTNMVQAWVDELGIDTVLNKRGTTWRKQSDEHKALADSNLDFAIALLVNNTSMIKRPIIQGTHNQQPILLCGFDVGTLTDCFS